MNTENIDHWGHGNTKPIIGSIIYQCVYKYLDGSIDRDNTTLLRPSEAFEKGPMTIARFIIKPPKNKSNANN